MGGLPALAGFRKDKGGQAAHGTPSGCVSRKTRKNQKKPPVPEVGTGGFGSVENTKVRAPVSVA